MSQELDGEGRKRWLIDTYEEWVEQQGIPVIEGYSVPDLMEVPLEPWERKGGRGAFVRLAGAEGVNDAYVCEIPPGSSLKPQRHMYDELIYVLSGRGATTVWNEESAKQTFEWQEGSLFSPPLNTLHRHFNTQGEKPARFLGVTMAPIFLNLFNDRDFIFNNSHVFKNRFSGESDYFSTQGSLLQARVWETNFVPDVRAFKLEQHGARGAGSSNMRFQMSNSVMESHVSEYPVGTYKKAHRHSPGAHVVILSGQGYTLMWMEDKPMMRIDWKAGSMIVPPGLWFHQHFNTGKEPAKYLALRAGETTKFKGILKHYQTFKSVKLGGDQIEYEDESPEIRRLFKEELAKANVEWRMSQFFPEE